MAATPPPTGWPDTPDVLIAARREEMPTQLRPASRVRNTDVHGGLPQAASASTKPSVAESKVTDTGITPDGTGPPAGPGKTDDGVAVVVGTEATGVEAEVVEPPNVDVDLVSFEPPPLQALRAISPIAATTPVVRIELIILPDLVTILCRPCPRRSNLSSDPRSEVNVAVETLSNNWGGRSEGRREQGRPGGDMDIGTNPATGDAGRKANLPLRVPARRVATKRSRWCQQRVTRAL
ncbi:MAG: hypothetical protein M3N98_00405 [Actinomycetota bacterium]|nr:hypothetical protein [Actinomycetota bacterium]